MRRRQPGRWARLFHDPDGLKPVSSRRGWIAAGVVLEVAGVGAPLAVVVARARRESVTGQITRATVKLAWHEVIRAPADAALIGAGALVFAAGAVCAARPFVTRTSMLVLAVPIGAVVGILVLGALAIIVALVILALDIDADPGDFGGGRRRKRMPPGVGGP